jgi:hypothetical protein
MSGSMTLTPPIDASVEVETICFDYGLLLQDGPLTITSVLSMTCTAIAGIDADAATRFVGGSVISSSRETGANSGSVLQQVGNMVAGVTYVLRCVAGISDGQRLSLAGTLSCVQAIGADAPIYTTIVAVGYAPGVGTASATGHSSTAPVGDVPMGLLLSLMG